MYIINKSDGTIAATVNEGVINTTDTDLALVGKNYLVYGELINENFVKLLENFSNNEAPVNPIKGQLWYDSANDKILVYNDINFRPINSVDVSAASPLAPRIGDLWYDNINQQLKFWNGANWIIVAPLFNANETRSGIFVETVNDNLGNPRVITSIWNNNIRVVIFSNSEFTPSNAIAGFPSIKQGLNLYDAGTFNGTARNSQLLDNKSPNDFFILNTNSVSTGNLKILNNNALTLGNNENLSIGVDFDGVFLKSLLNEQDIYIKVKDGTGSELTPLIINGNGLVEVNTTLRVENLSTNSVTIEGASNFDSDVDINANLTVNNISVVSSGDFNNIVVASNITGNTFVSNTTNFGNTKTVSLQVNDTRTSADVNINGNVELHNNKISFVDNLGNSGYVRGEAGFLYFGTQGTDRAYFRPDGIAVFLDGAQGALANFNVIQSGNFTVINDLLTSTQTNGDVNISGAGSGQVVVNKLKSNTSVLAESLIVTGSSSNAIDCAGGLTVAGALTVSGPINITGATFTNNVTSSNLNATAITAGTIAGAIVTNAQPNITSLGILSSLNVSGTTSLGFVQTGNIQGNNFTASNNIVGQLVLATSANIGTLTVNSGASINGSTLIADNLLVLGEIRCENDIVAFYSSDERLKTNINVLENTLDKISNIQGVSFNWNELAQSTKEKTDKDQIGLIAQQVKSQFPELVNERDDGYLSVDYIKLTAVLLQAINELHSEVKKLKG
jgi:hypothetical protein